MPALTTSDMLQLAIQAEFDQTEDVVNVYEFQCGTVLGLTEAEWADELIDLATAIITVIKALQSGMTIYRRLRGVIMTQVDAGRQVEFPTPIPGTAVGDPCPSGICALQVFRTATPGVVLKKYIGTTVEPHISTIGQFTPAAMALGAAFGAFMLAPIVTSRATWYYGKWDGLSTLIQQPTSMYMNAEPGYQRRRRRGYGS